MADKLVRNPNDEGVVERFRDESDGSWASVVELPARLLTDGNGPSARLRVDTGQTGFFAGREARTFKELNIASGATYVLRATVPLNIILFGLELSIEDGWLRLGSYVGGTPGGVWSEVLPILPTNTMTSRPTPFYVPSVVLDAGGTHTGGTELDVIRLKTANATGSAISVGNMEDSERGVAAGTYYFRLLNLGPGAVQGTLKARWEERP